MGISGHLLDTSAFLRANLDLGRLSKAAQTAIEESQNLYVSLATVWEMQIKHALGKLELSDNADRIATRFASALEAEFLDIRIEHLARLYELPMAHKDPFDRLLVSQAITEDLAIISPDSRFADYAVRVIW